MCICGCILRWMLWIKERAKMYYASGKRSQRQSSVREDSHMYRALIPKEHLRVMDDSVRRRRPQEPRSLADLHHHLIMILTHPSSLHSTTALLHAATFFGVPEDRTDGFFETDAICEVRFR